MRSISTSFLLRCLPISLCLLIIALANNASASGELRGVVVSRETGTPLPGAVVRIESTSFVTIADSAGLFFLSNIPSGRYAVEVSLIGYQSQILANQVIQDNSVIEIKFALEEKLVQLPEVIVMPGYFSIMRNEPTVRQTLTREDIRNLPASGEDLYRAVRRLPGITASDYSARFNVRGGERNEVLVLFDGVELYEPFHLKDVDGGVLSIIDPEVIGGVSLMTGGFPVEYGDRLSGVFDVRTLQAAQRRKTTVGISLINARFMSQGTFAKDQGQWMISARRGYIDLMMKLLYPGNLFTPTYYDLFGNVSYALAAKHRLSIGLLHAGDHLDVAENDGDMLKSNYGNSNGWLNLKSFFGSKLYAETVLSFAQSDQRRQAINEQRRFARQDSVVDKRNLTVGSVKQNWSWELSLRHFLKWGLEIKRFSTSYQYFHRDRFWISYADSSVVEDEVSTVSIKPADIHYGLYFADRVRIAEPLTAELGMRYDVHTHANDRNFSPRLNLAYTLNGRTVLRMGWGKFHQSQRVNEINIQDGDESLYPAELAEHRVLGLEYAMTNLANLRVEIYQKRLSRLRPRYFNQYGAPEFMPELQDDRRRLEPEYGDAKGIEIFFKNDAGRFAWWCSYGYSRAREMIDGQYIPKSFDQRHTIYVDLNYHAGKNWQFNVAWQYHSGWPVTDLYGPLNAARYPDFHRMDVRANRSFNIGNGRLSAFLEVANLYNRFNVRNYYYELVRSENGDRYLVRKAERWFPRLPSFGVSWEF